MLKWDGPCLSFSLIDCERGRMSTVAAVSCVTSSQGASHARCASCTVNTASTTPIRLHSLHCKVHEGTTQRKQREREDGNRTGKTVGLDRAQIERTRSNDEIVRRELGSRRINMRVRGREYEFGTDMNNIHRLRIVRESKSVARRHCPLARSMWVRSSEARRGRSTYLFPEACLLL